jgi:hypothetical protein
VRTHRETTPILLSLADLFISPLLFISPPLQSFLVCAQGFNIVENNMEFRVYATHRESWHFYKAVNAARVEFFAAIKRLREELGITFLKATQPVQIVTRSPEMCADEDTCMGDGDSSVSERSSPFVDARLAVTAKSSVAKRMVVEERYVRERSRAISGGDSVCKESRKLA